MESNKFGFVVLHYLVAQETIQCVQSILEHISQDVEIVIVDNGSKNGSIESVQSVFQGRDNIHIIINKDNEGFARGNNVGYQYCRNILRTSFIIVLNNDVTLSKDFALSRCEKDYTMTKCGVIGPDIISKKTGEHQNPESLHFKTIIDIWKWRITLLLKLWRIRLGLLPSQKSIDTQNVISKRYDKDDQCTRIVNKLHGSCYIFTPDFVASFQDAFDPRTFLYVEEDILAIRCKQHGLTMLYDPYLIVEHEEDASTEAMLDSDMRKKQIFVIKENIKSLGVLSTYYK